MFRAYDIPNQLLGLYHQKNLKMAGLIAPVNVLKKGLYMISFYSNCFHTNAKNSAICYREVISLGQPNIIKL